MVKEGKPDKVLILKVSYESCLTVNCMWRSRLRASFLSNRDEVKAGDELTITHRPGYDIYRLLN